MKIDIQGMSLQYGNVDALIDATVWDILPGEFHAFVGHNGSGKTSFLQCLAGVLPEEASVTGRLLIDGVDVLPFWDRDSARREGISYVPQSPSLVEELTALENIVLGVETISWNFFWNKASDEQKVSDLMKRLELDIPLNIQCKELSASDRQKIGIIRGLLPHNNQNFVLLDEPTTRLEPKEKQALLCFITNLCRNKGIGIIFVSHDASDFVDVADKITRFSNGSIVNTYSPEEFQFLPELKDEEIHTSSGVFCGNPSKMFSFKGTAVKGNCYNSINLSLPAGKIGNVLGDEELLDDFFWHLCGFTTQYQWSGEVNLLSQVINGKSISERRNLGMGFIPGDNELYGVFGNLTVHENIIVNHNGEEFFVFSNSCNDTVRNILLQVGISDTKQFNKANTLSGGFKQRLIFAREYAQNPHLLILRNPAQGLDFSSKLEMCRDLSIFVQKGGAVLLLDSDLNINGCEFFSFKKVKDYVAICPQKSSI